MKFVKLTEVNEHEGETWRFWLQVDGNEAELGRLRGAIDAVAQIYGDGEPGCPFVLAALSDAKSEAYVDVLVDETQDDEGYMAPNHKITGTLSVPSWPAPGDFGSHIEQDLYKGGVAKLFRETAAR
jgi:hypothetical protein